MSQVLIVGGGPAGLAAAISLAEVGIASCLLERGTWPRDKVCGEGLMPNGVAFLHQHQIFPHLRQSRPFQGICYFDPSGIVAQADFASGKGLGIRRLDLSAALVARAKELPLIQLLPEHELVTWQNQPQSVLATIKDHTKDHSWQQPFSLMIAADGLRSKIRKAANLQGSAPGKQKRWGVRQHFALPPWNDHVEIHWQRGIEAYVTPSGPKQVELAFLWDRQQFRLQQHKGLAGFIELFPDLQQKFHDAPSLSSFQGIGPLAQAATFPVTERVVLLGDAFTYLDGITGEGIAIAFSQAELLAKFFPQILSNPSSCSSLLQQLGQQIQAKTHTYLTMTQLALFFTRHPTLRHLAIRGLSRSPKAFQHFLEANLGRKSVVCFPVTTLPKLTWGLFFPRRLNL